MLHSSTPKRFCNAGKPFSGASRLMCVPASHQLCILGRVLPRWVGEPYAESNGGPLLVRKAMEIKGGGEEALLLANVLLVS